jgi:hypothetical protein
MYDLIKKTRGDILELKGWETRAFKQKIESVAIK